MKKIILTLTAIAALASCNKKNQDPKSNHTQQCRIQLYSPEKIIGHIIIIEAGKTKAKFFLNNNNADTAFCLIKENSEIIIQASSSKLITYRLFSNGNVILWQKDLSINNNKSL